MNNKDSVVVRADPDLADFIPDYLEHRRSDVILVTDALEKGNYEAIRVIGHQMRGSGAGYGFDALTEIGTALELAATAADKEAVSAALAALDDYIGRVEVVYE